MKPKDFKGRCTKKKLKKSKEVVKLYDKIQIAYADVLDNDDEISEIRCNVLLEDLEEGKYTSDFVCIKTNGEMMVRECVFRSKLGLPRTCKLLDASHLFWAKRGVTDWGLVIDREESDSE